MTRGLRATTIRALGLALTALTFLSLLPSATASAAEYTHILEPGQRLYAGDTLYSPNHSYRLIMQGDGNLVIYNGGTALWSTKTNGHSGASAVMQGDGNFVVYQSGHALWNSHTDHHGGAVLDMQDDGNLVIRESGSAIWATGTNQPSAPAPHSPTTYTHILEPGQRLYAGDTLYSPNHSYRLIMQGDGNLVIYNGGTALWSSKTNGHGGANAIMQGDGNFVVYQSGYALWNSHTDHHGGAKLDMQDDGNLVIYDSGTAIWSTQTNQPSPPSAPAPHSPTTYTHILEPGQRLYAGDTLYSPNHSYRLIMQGDGNLVIYNGGTALWSTKTNGHSGASAVMQGDGNFVVYQSGHALWNSHTDHHGGAVLDMQDDGNLVIRESGSAIWATGTNRRHSSSTPGGTHAKAPGRRHANIAPPGRRLKPGAVIHSPSHAYRLVMQGDGNLVVYKGHKAIWSTGTNGHGGAEAVMQGDGNLVVYWHGHAIWTSHTDHHGGANLHMQNDGNLVIYWHGHALWASKGASASSKGQAIVRAAARWAGTQYCWAGGNQSGPTHGTRDPYNGLECARGTTGFDCTGLTLYAVYQATHILLPHGTGQAFAAGGANVARSALKPGDLVFFGPSLANFTHAGVYAGGGKMWDAQTEGVPVKQHGLYRNYVGARRYWH